MVAQPTLLVRPSSTHLATQETTAMLEVLVKVLPLHPLMVNSLLVLQSMIPVSQILDKACFACGQSLQGAQWLEARF